MSQTIVEEVIRALGYPKLRKYIAAAIEGRARYIVVEDSNLPDPTQCEGV